MNDLQKKQFELLKCFTDICSKLDLQYYLVCGSALGAVKYGGFIPWDDDVDVALPRRDYEIFLEKAPDYLPKNFFLQNYRTDKQFPMVFTKLRNSDTTYVEKYYKDLDIHHGVFIDVFALDGYPQSRKEQVSFDKRMKSFVRKSSCSLDVPRSKKAKLLCTALRFLGFHKCTQKTLYKYEAMLKEYSEKYNDILCNFGNFRGTPEKTPKDIYGRGCKMTFEGLEVIVPKQYDKYLREKYGDYRKDPPLNEQTGHHYYAALDLENSYTSVIKK